MEALTRATVAIIIAFSMSYNGLKKGSLSKTGCIAAFFTGFVGFYSSYTFGVILILFYLTSSKLTKTGKATKAKLEADYGISSQRGAMQVFGSSIFASLLAVLFIVYVPQDHDIQFRSDFLMEYHEALFNPVAMCSLFYRQISLSIDGGLNNSDNQVFICSILNCLYIAHYACATADTWASEVSVPLLVLFQPPTIQLTIYSQSLMIS